MKTESSNPNNSFKHWMCPQFCRKGEWIFSFVLAKVHEPFRIFGIAVNRAGIILRLHHVNAIHRNNHMINLMQSRRILEHQIVQQTVLWLWQFPQFLTSPMLTSLASNLIAPNRYDCRKNQNRQNNRDIPNSQIRLSKSNGGKTHHCDPSSLNNPHLQHTPSFAYVRVEWQKHKTCEN